MKKQKDVFKRTMILGAFSMMLLSCTVYADDTLQETSETAAEETENTVKALNCENGDVTLPFDLEAEENGALCLFEEKGKTCIKLQDSEEDEPVSVKLKGIPETFYVTTSLYIRELPDTESEITQILDIQQKITVYGEADGWYLAGTEKGYGFVSAKYLTDSEEEAKQAAEAEEAAREAAEAEWAAQQAAWAAQQQAWSAPKKSSSKSNKKQVYEVSRENIPSCADGSHGTTYITYSDGSVKTVEY